MRVAKQLAGQLNLRAELLSNHWNKKSGLCRVGDKGQRKMQQELIFVRNNYRETNHSAHTQIVQVTCSRTNYKTNAGNLNGRS